MKKIIALILAIFLISSSLFAISCAKDSDKTPLNDPEDETVNLAPTLIVGATEVNLMVGETYDIKYVLKNTQDSVEFLSKDNSVVTVDVNGKVTAVDIGEAIVSLSAGEILKNIVFNVKATNTYSVICQDGNDISLAIGNDFKLRPILIRGAEVFDAQFNFVSGDESIAKVDSEGVVSIEKRGKCFIEIFTTKDGHVYNQFVFIQGHELCYIDATNFTANFKEEIKVPYAVRDYKTNEIIADATVEIEKQNGIIINGDKITFNDYGDVNIKLNYYGVEKTVTAKVIYKTAENEFNLFKDAYAIKDCFACDRYGYGNSIKYAKMSLVDTALGETLQVGKFLKVEGVDTKNSHISDLSILINCLKSKEQLIEMKNNGYKYVQIKFYADCDSNVRPYLYYKVKATQNEATSFNNQWIRILIPLEDYITGYDSLNNIANKTSFEKYTGLMRYCKRESDVTPYTLYFKPIEIVK